MSKISEVFNNSNVLYFIGEISCNHNNDLSIVKETMLRLKANGADAVKIQTDFLDGSGSTMDFKTSFFEVKGTIWQGRNLYDLYKEAHTPLSWHHEIFDFANSIGLECFSTPYSDASIKFLKDFKIPAIKVASMEANDVDFVSKCAEIGVPIIISTGMLQPDEFSNTLEACYKTGNSEIVLLNCTSEYPAPPEQANASVVNFFKKKYGVITGLSDHTLDDLAGQITVSHGGQVFEKHVKLDDTITGPDASFSLTCEKFGKFVRNVKLAKNVCGSGVSEERFIDVNYSRSIFVIKDVQVGDILSEKNIKVIRPGHGIHPNSYRKVLGKKFNCKVNAGNPLTWDLIDE